ncbi:MAG: sigma-70 family RNA polymerase sigma factor [Ignisphaera sp.]|nr:sigma-70 family RNA polymerase sigma factor [Ignisphaera sp.]
MSFRINYRGYFNMKKTLISQLNEVTNNLTDPLAWITTNESTTPLIEWRINQAIEILSKERPELNLPPVSNDAFAVNSINYDNLFHKACLKMGIDKTEFLDDAASEVILKLLPGRSFEKWIKKTLLVNPEIVAGNREKYISTVAKSFISFCLRTLSDDMRSKDTSFNTKSFRHLNHTSHLNGGDWVDLTTKDADEVLFNTDTIDALNEFIATLPALQQSVIRDLLAGKRASDIARERQLTTDRVRQINAMVISKIHRRLKPLFSPAPQRPVLRLAAPTSRRIVTPANIPILKSVLLGHDQESGRYDMTDEEDVNTY